jgi:hypothetical protein
MRAKKSAKNMKKQRGSEKNLEKQECEKTMKRRAQGVAISVGVMKQQFSSQQLFKHCPISDNKHSYPSVNGGHIKFYAILVLSPIMPHWQDIWCWLGVRHQTLAPPTTRSEGCLRMGAGASGVKLLHSATNPNLNGQNPGEINS